ERTGAKDSAGDEYRQAILASRPTDRIRSGSKSSYWRAGYRSDDPRAGAAATASAPVPVVAAPPPPSNLTKVTIVRNGESKEYSVTRTVDAATQGRRQNRAGAATN